MNTANREAAMLDADRPTVGGWHILHLILSITSMGIWIIVWVLHAIIVSSKNSTIDKKIRIVEVYSDETDESGVVYSGQKVEAGSGDSLLLFFREPDAWRQLAIIFVSTQDRIKRAFLPVLKIFASCYPDRIAKLVADIEIIEVTVRIFQAVRRGHIAFAMDVFFREQFPVLQIFGFREARSP